MIDWIGYPTTAGGAPVTSATDPLAIYPARTRAYVIDATERVFVFPTLNHTSEDA